MKKINWFPNQLEIGAKLIILEELTALVLDKRNLFYTLGPSRIFFMVIVA